MPLKFSLLVEITVFSQFEGFEIILEVADEKSLKSLGEDNRSNWGCKIGNLGDNLAFSEADEEYFSLKTNTQKFLVLNFKSVYFFGLLLLDHPESIDLKLWLKICRT